MGLVALLPTLLCPFGCKKKQPTQLPPPTVEVTQVFPQDVPIYREWIGSLDGSTNAAIRAQVSGYLLSQDYREGTQVKSGDLLFHIDPRPFQAALDQAKGALGKAQAQLTKTEQDVRRYTPLAKEGTRVNNAAAVSAIPGVAFVGGSDGVLRALSTADGKVIWEYNTARDFDTVNKVAARGGAINSIGPTIVNGMLFIGSGYAVSGNNFGNALLAFSLE
jgi:outer membrane protein assembly factor BamB